MKVLLLAAGRGERMRPLTESTPKPLLEVAGRALIEHHLERLVEHGHSNIMVNLSWMGAAIRGRLGDGSRYGASLSYSDEGPEPLETAGAIVAIQDWLGQEPFAVVNADIWTDYPFNQLALPNRADAHLVLVPNPAHNIAGDFVLDGGIVHNLVAGDTPTLTFAGIGVYAPRLFAGLEHGKRALAPILRELADRGALGGERYEGEWMDIGTPERLAELRARFA